jgi:hypothetical protein
MVFDLSWKQLKSGESGLTPVLRVIAMAVWLAALLVIARAAIRSRETPERIRSRLGELTALAVQDGRLAAWQAADQAFKRRPHAERPYDLMAQAALLTGGMDTNQVRESSRTPVAGGWEAVRVQVRAENMALGALSPLIEAGESADPPWRLMGFSIEPLSPKPGKGRVLLEFETLKRSLPEP